LSAEPWIGPQGRSQRAIIFLDPYGISVDFSTLRLIAETERADVWYLVNLKGVVQQLAHNHARLDAAKRQSLTGFFGEPDWEKSFYEFQESATDLFSGITTTTGERNVRREDVAAFYRRRLDSIFKYVSAPLGLTVGTQQDYFQFYCMSNNPSVKARALIKKGAEAVIRKHAKAFRHTSAP
jgi:three-Cys-motif partner protein